MSAPGSKKTKVRRREEKKEGRTAQLLSHTCCPDSQGPANTHLFDGYMYPCGSLQAEFSHV